MYYTNTMKVTLKNNTVANKALEILRSRLSAGFAADNGYRRSPSQIMSDALEVVDNTIVLPEDFGCYITEDAEGVVFELVQNLAENIDEDTFTVENWNQKNKIFGFSNIFPGCYHEDLQIRIGTREMPYPVIFASTNTCSKSD